MPFHIAFVTVKCYHKEYKHTYTNFVSVLTALLVCMGFENVQDT